MVVALWLPSSFWRPLAMGSPTGWLAMSIRDAIRHHNACPLVLFWLPGVALDLILDAPDIVLEALDIILEALD